MVPPLPGLGERARQALNAWLERLELAPLLADADLIASQRQNFLNEFGPERLAGLDGPELLRWLPYNLANDQPLDYWLEFRHDAVFNNRLFGGMGGGSAAKFGTWQDRHTGHWRALLRGSRPVQDISEQQALEMVAGRRREMLAAAAVLGTFADRPLQELDPDAVQTAVTAAAPRWHSSAWLHKYLHLVFPQRVTWNATQAYLQAYLYRLGRVASGSGLYALDLKLLQFLHSLPALSQLPVWLRYRLIDGLLPREHGCLNLAGDATARQAMLVNDRLALGPAQTGNLAGLFSLSRRTEARKGIAIAFQEAGLVATPRQVQDLLNLGCSLPPGSLVALLSNVITVTAVGEVSGTYRYGFREEQPHQLPVHWLHQQPFLLSEPVDCSGGSLRRLPPSSPVVADLEASLLANGIFPAGETPFAVREETPAYASLEPPTGIIGQLLEMLERKQQVVLYGPPGTGKTYYAEQTALEMIARYNFHCLPSQLSQYPEDSLYGRDGHSSYIVFCTFHPLYSYEDFIEGYRPEREGFSLKPGLFRRLVTAAQAQPDKRFVLIIDEINRGNIPKIFGELITLLEPARRGRSGVVLPLSGDNFSVPVNLYLIATMNTADRSILLLDTALRRRFGFKELLPAPELLQDSMLGEVSLAVWLRALNRRIGEHLGRDGRNLQVGHAYFMPHGKPVTTLKEIAAIVREDIWPLLQEYGYEDPRALAAMLAADQGGIYDYAAADLRQELFEPGREEELIAALLAVVTSEDRETAAR
jgi:5-methylcytosine-specific restriction protein B